MLLNFKDSLTKSSAALIPHSKFHVQLDPTT